MWSMIIICSILHLYTFTIYIHMYNKQTQKIIKTHDNHDHKRQTHFHRLDIHSNNTFNYGFSLKVGWEIENYLNFILHADEWRRELMTPDLI